MLSALFFVGTFVSLVALALWRYPICGLYLYLLTLFVHPPSRWWGSLLPDLRWAMLAAVIALAALIIHRNKLQAGRPPWLATIPGLVLAVLVGWMCLQSFWALGFAAHQDAVLQYAKYGVAFYLIYRLANTPDKLLDFLTAHVCGCAYLGWLGYVAGRTGDRLDGVGGPGINDANTLAMMMATGFIVGAVIVLTQVGWRRLICALCLPVVLNGVFLAGSRGAFLGLVCGCFVLLLLRPKRRFWMVWGGAALGLVMAAKLVDQQFIDRMFTIEMAAKQDGEVDASSESRLVLIDAQLRMFARYPHGTGHKGTSLLSSQYLDPQWLTGVYNLRRSSHNTFMTLLVEQGVPGALIFIWIVLWGVSVVIRVWRMRSQDVPQDALACATACCAALTVPLVSGMFTDYFMAEVQIWLFAVLAVALQHLRPAEHQPASAAPIARYSTG